MNNLEVPYKNVLSVNFLKNIFKGDKLTLTLTGTSQEKIEIRFIDNIEEECKEINDMIQSSKK